MPDLKNLKARAIKRLVDSGTVAAGSPLEVAIEHAFNHYENAVEGAYAVEIAGYKSRIAELEGANASLVAPAYAAPAIPTEPPALPEPPAVE